MLLKEIEENFLLMFELTSICAGRRRQKINKEKSFLVKLVNAEKFPGEQILKIIPARS
jgi:hypothetical protein